MFMRISVYLERWQVLCGDQSASSFESEFWDGTSH
jgi:hypothetical protein